MIKQQLRQLLYFSGLLNIILPNKVIEIKKNIDTKKEIRSITNEKSRIGKIPRYEPGIFQIEGMRIKFVDSASFLFMYNEIFESQIYKFKSNNEEPIIIDCGANIGISVLYFKRIFQNSIIIAFEPDIIVFETLKENCIHNELNKVELINKAVWDTETEKAFLSDGADTGRIFESTENQSLYKVKTIRLRDFLRKYKEIDFLKIDIEGAETVVILDCKDDFNIVKNIFIEYHSFVGETQNLDIILKILKDSGFRIHITTPGLTSLQPFVHLNYSMNMDLQLNIFGVKLY